MPAKKKSVTTPLHLLQQLSLSLIDHLDQACARAIKDAESTLAKLQKQRGKAQDKLTKVRAKLDDAGNAGKAKAQVKARSRLGELERNPDLPGRSQARCRAEPEAGPGYPEGRR
mgnify:CR=1 FL=1